MKNTITKTLCLLFSLLLTNTSKAQYETKYPDCGVLIDGVLADKIDCWSFKEMSVVYPVKGIKKCDRYTLEIIGGLPIMGTKVLLINSGNSFGDYFAAGDLGITIVLDPRISALPQDGGSFRYSYSTIPSDCKLYTEKDIQENNQMYLRLSGEMIVGSTETQIAPGKWEKTPKYGERAIIYQKVITLPPLCIEKKKSKKNPESNCKIDYNTTCPVSGKKFEHTIEIASYSRNGIVKLKK